MPLNWFCSSQVLAAVIEPLFIVLQRVLPRTSQSLDSIIFSTGLIGWVPNTDTLHALIREYRDTRKIPLNIEHRLMLGMAPDYDHLTVIQKVEVFRHALESTPSKGPPNMTSPVLLIPPVSMAMLPLQAFVSQLHKHLSFLRVLKT